MKNFYLDFYRDPSDLYDHNGILELDVPDYLNDVEEDPRYIVTGCDPSEYDFDDLPF